MLNVFTGNLLNSLLKQMSENISKSSRNPLEKTAVCIQTSGMQRWVGLQLARENGISANLDFLFPGALMKRLAGVKAGERGAWFDKQELIWKVFDKLISLPDEQIYSSIAAYLSDDKNGIKSFRLAGRIADTFDQYQIYRPQMVLDWLKVKPENPPDEKDVWQMELFRSVFSRGEMCKTHAFNSYIKGSSDDTDSPIHIFGISVMPNFFIEMLKKASENREVNLYLLSPTREYWGDSKTIREKRRLEKIADKSAKELYIEEKHELLDNLGVIGRDFFDYIFGSDDIFADESRYSDISPETVLATIQSEILNLECTDRQPQKDDSIVVNSCHNRLREVEVLYDQLLKAFEDYPSLKPSDILIMTPDIELYSPYIKSVFDNPYTERELIPYSVADISEKHSSRPAGVFLELIAAVRGDFSLFEVHNILSYDIIAENFQINRGDLPAITKIFAKSGTCWGYDGDHLRERGLDISDGFTWEKAVRRICLGLAEGSTGDRYSETAAKDIPFSMAEELGSVIRFYKLAQEYAKEFQQRKSVEQWCALLSGMAEDFISKEFEHADDLLHLSRCIAKIAEEANISEFQTDIPPEPVLERLAEILTETRGAKGFMNGRVTFCAMLPMRSIPFKVIGIIGLNENTFPRQKDILEFDLIARKPIPGDRNNRDSDRYLFLETLISAERRLILSYCGQDEKNNSELPPSTLVTELLAHLEKRFDIKDITQKHKLHSFSKDYFKDGALFTYSKERYEAFLSFAMKRQNNFADTEIEAEETEEVTLSKFENFFIDPAEHFLKNTLGIQTKVYDEKIPETEALELDTLMKYKLEDETYKSILDGKGALEELEYLYDTAQLPPANLGLYHIRETVKTGEDLVQETSKALSGSHRKYEVDIEIGELRIKGELSPVTKSSYAYARPAKLKAKDLIRGWIRHLILNREGEVTTELIGGTSSLTIPPVKNEQLKTLVNIFRRGSRRPLRFHITDGLSKDKRLPGIEMDKHSNRLESHSYRICFGSEDIDEDAYEAIVLPILRFLRKER